MSMGQLDIIGDEVHIELPNTSYYHRGQGFRQGSLNRHLLRLVDQVYEWVDFKEYDNWRFNFPAQQWVWDIDDTVDMVIMSYKYIPSDNDSAHWFFCGHTASGEASLGSWCDAAPPPPLVLDGKTICGDFSHYGSGCINIGQRLKYSGVTGIIEHEICHSFFIQELHYGRHSSMGIMTGLDNTCYIMSPFERSRPILGWNINPTDVTTTGIYTLGDYVETGQKLRIQIPETSEYFWVANHQKISLYDGVSRGSEECFNINYARQDLYCGVGKGLFIYHESSTNCPNNFNKALDLEQAEGKWDWVFDRCVPYYFPGYNFTIPLFEQFTPNGGNPLYGKSEYLEHIFCGTVCNWGNRCWGKDVSDNRCSDELNPYHVTLKKMNLTLIIDSLYLSYR